jgi:prolycopene isomerase
MTASGSPEGWLERLVGVRNALRIKSIVTRAPVTGRQVTRIIERLRPRADYPAVVVGSGIGGLTSAAYLAKHGFKVKVIEKHEQPGGYATSFSRGDFRFEVSLHATCVNDNPQSRILEELGVLDRISMEPLPDLHRVVTPSHDVHFPHADAAEYKQILVGKFPAEEKGINAFVDEMVGVADEVDRLARNDFHFTRLLFPVQYRHMWNLRDKTLYDLLAKHIASAELRSLLAVTWPYYGLPPSRLSAFYFSVATGDYINKGGYYIRNRSQDLSNTLVSIIEENGGEVILGRKVERILTRSGAATGVADAEGREYPARAVISNASAPSTFLDLVGDDGLTNGYGDRLRALRPSLSSFVVWLGLDQDITKRIRDAEIFLTAGHDPELDYSAALNVDPANVALAVTVYDNIFPDYSPPGKTTMSIMFLSGYHFWRRFEKDYRAGRKDAYNEEKERIADAIVERVERRLVPGLTDMIEEYEVSTPLTNIRYTGNPEGAIYGYEQSLGNSFMTRLENRTPIRFLYLASSWASPGGGFAGTLRSGQQTFRCLIDDWSRS